MVDYASRREEEIKQKLKKLGPWDKDWDALWSELFSIQRDMRFSKGEPTSGDFHMERFKCAGRNVYTHKGVTIDD